MIKYFQQSLAALVSSLRSSEKFEIAKACENYLTKDPKFPKNFFFSEKYTRSGYWNIYLVEEGRYHMSL